MEWLKLLTKIYRISIILEFYIEIYRIHIPFCQSLSGMGLCFGGVPPLLRRTKQYMLKKMRPSIMPSNAIRGHRQPDLLTVSGKIFRTHSDSIVLSVVIPLSASARGMPSWTANCRNTFSSPIKPRYVGQTNLQTFRIVSGHKQVF